MKFELYITIDTEPDCDIHWNRSFPFTFTSVLQGIPEILRPIWDKYKINPIYFVSPEVVSDKACCDVLKNEISKGAIIGTHLHSEYIEPNRTFVNGGTSNEFPCFAHDKNIELEKIRNLTDLIKKNLGYNPEWYRAARFGADLNTIQSLQKLGYKFDSSVTPHISWAKQGGPDHSKAPEQPYWISADNFYQSVSREKSIGIKEFPVSISGKRMGAFGSVLPDKWLFYNWLRPSHMSVAEQKKLVNTYIKRYKNPTFVMMFHSMEIMIGKTPYVKNKKMQKYFLNRLEKTIEYIIQKNG
ncbi:MAG: hypothetical protein HY840_13890 [Bacteroidetes bacterium]|nr:hypothetical protein [Bacteroidota bacterium]